MYVTIYDDLLPACTLSAEALAQAESQFLGDAPFRDVIVLMERSSDSDRVSDWRRVDPSDEPAAAHVVTASHVTHVETPLAKDL